MPYLRAGCAFGRYTADVSDGQRAGRVPAFVHPS
jgi:hypothetical protein